MTSGLPAIITLLAASLILSTVKASTQVDVSGLVGQEVDLPCQIDTKMCGTLHSIKWYRGSSRIYVFSDAHQFHKPEGEYAARANLTYHQNDATSYLNVKNLSIADEAVYKCEITYLDVIESCLVVQFINLTTLIEPKSIKVTLNSSKEVVNGTSIGEVNEGEKLSLTCEVGEAKPIPSLYWYKYKKDGRNDKKPEMGQYVPKVGTNAMGSAINRIDIQVSRSDLGATYVCQSFVQGLNHSLSVHVVIDVNVKPDKMEIRSEETIYRQNEEVSITCNVYNAKPAATVTWYNGTIPLEKHDNQVNITDKETKRDSDGTSITKSRLSFRATRHENYGIFKCVAHNKVMTKEDEGLFVKTRTIEVLYPPVISITPHEVEVNETGEVLLKCMYWANPKLTRRGIWYFNDRRITENETEYEFSENSLRLRKADRNSMGVYFCSLENEVGVSNSSKATVNVLYPPTVYVEPMTSTVVNETDRREISFVCKVYNGNPGELEEVRWYHNGRFMEDKNISNLVLDGVKENHGNYSCAGRTSAGLGPVSAPQEVRVQRLPGPASIWYYLTNDPEKKRNPVVKKGDKITLACHVRELGWPPTTQYVWHLGTSESKSGQIENMLVIDNAKVGDMLNNFTCKAANAAGYGENASIALEIHAPPLILNTITYVNASVNDSSAEIRCDIECYPLCDVSWKVGDEPIDNSSKKYEILNEYKGAAQDKNDFPSVTSKLRLITKEFEGGALKPYVDDASYTCVSTANDVGPGVESTIVFKVHFPPTNMTIKSTTGLVRDTVREGNIPPRVLCDSDARPSATYRWYNTLTNETVSSGAVLNFARPINRSNEWTFTCEAVNEHGRNTTNLVFTFEYKPSCVIEPFEEDDAKGLECKAIGNPAVNNYTWTKVVKEETEKVNLETRAGKLNLDISNEDETYYCVASNVVGQSEPCKYDVPASGNWLMYLLKTQRYFIYLAIAIGVIFLVIIICSLIILICRKRRANEKCSNDLSNKSKNSFHSANDALLQPDNDKTFYENLPFHGMQNPPNKASEPSSVPASSQPETEGNVRPSSSQSQYDGSSGYGSTRSRNTGTVAPDQKTEPDGDDSRFNSLRPKRSRPNWPQFRSLRTPKKSKIAMLPIKESSPGAETKPEDEQVPKILPKPVPAPRKVIGFSFNKPSAKHTYQNVPIPITPNSASQNAAIDKSKASSHLTNSSPMEYFRLTPTNKTRQYNGSITTNLSLKKPKSNNVLSPTFPRSGPPTVPRHHSSYPSTHQLNNGLVYADLTVSRHKKKHHRHAPISNTQTYPYHTEYAVIKFHDVGREIDV